MKINSFKSSTKFWVIVGAMSYFYALQIMIQELSKYYAGKHTLFCDWLYQSGSCVSSPLP